MAFRNSVINESDRVFVDKFIRKRTFEIISQNPLEFFKHALNSAIHVPLLNPFHIYSDHNFISGETYYITDTHDKLVPVRIIYTLIIYIILTLNSNCFEIILNIIWPTIGWKRLLRYWVIRITRLPGSVYSISAGFACGAAISFTPFVGLHFILGALFVKI